VVVSLRGQENSDFRTTVDAMAGNSTALCRRSCDRS